MRKTKLAPRTSRIAFTALAFGGTGATATAAGAISLLASLLLAPRPAAACGGFFCAQPPSPFAPPPVAQTGENVLFAMDRAPSGKFRLEAHVQIFYTGPADRFSWVVPTDSKPELDVGTNRLFTQIAPRTTPTFGVNWREEGTCKVTPFPQTNQSPGSFAPPGSSSQADAGSGAGGAGGAGGVSVSFRGDVGPYDAAVIKSTSTTDPKPVKDWLTENKYFISEEGSKLIDDYVREDKHFVAIRLLSNAMVSEIQPLVMRFEGPGPCIPIRLTSIATQPDLSVNLWVLGEHRVVPENFFEIRINPARIDWFQRGSNYQDLVKLAANEAGGNAFVVDYVGSPAFMRGQIYNGQYSVQRLAAATTPPLAVREVFAQGFMSDAALLGVLRKHIPMPDVVKNMGVSEQAFYSDLASFGTSTFWTRFRAQFAPFDSKMFAADIDGRIVKPLANAEALFGRYAKLTRLSTYLSADEMIVDPMFVQNPTLPDVPVGRSATAVRMCGMEQHTRCNAPVRLELPDGQKIYFLPRATQAECYPGMAWTGAPGSYDRATLDALPTLEISYQRAPVGEGTIRRSNLTLIETAIEMHNKRNNPPVLAMPPVSPTSPMRGGTSPVPGMTPASPANPQPTAALPGGTMPGTGTMTPGSTAPGGMEMAGSGQQSAASSGFGCALATGRGGSPVGAGGAASALAALAVALLVRGWRAARCVRARS